LPVSSFYLDSLKRIGLNIYNVSRWLNTVTFKTNDQTLLNKLGTLNFVKTIEKTQPVIIQPNETKETFFTEVYDSSSYGWGFRQIHVHNGEYLHQQGFRGEGMLIAVIDAGFYNYLTLPSFQNMLREDRIKGVRDFVNRDGEVNNDHTHGMQVLSIIGGEVEKSFTGTAPKANFLLLRSENASGENIVEEDNWVAAAEYADSLGADIINTSLGYTTFDNPLQNHGYSDMNGRTARISIAAEIASKKGLIVVVSAGNEGAAPWHYISAPADAKNILTVGAVNHSLIRAPFSSVGPTADSRIKPDVMAIGQGTYLQSTNNVIGSGNGTSFSAPVITGLTACLWQSAPKKSNIKILESIRNSSDRFLDPDNNYGYGIPDFKKAMFLLTPAFESKKNILVYPNPFLHGVRIMYKATSASSMLIEVFNTSGKKIFMNSFPIIPDMAGEIKIDDLTDIPRGIVIIRATSGNQATSVTAIKL
jgi:subtilisin family serine protease